MPAIAKPQNLKHEYDIAKQTCKFIQYTYALFSFIVGLYLAARSDSNIWLDTCPLMYHICLKKSFSVNGYFNYLLKIFLTNKILRIQTVRFVIGIGILEKFCYESGATVHNFFIGLSNL